MAIGSAGITNMGILLIAASSSLCASAQAATLQEVWAAAEEHNVALQIAHEKTIQASTGKWQALAYLMPQVSLRANYAFNQYQIDTSTLFSSITSQFPGLDIGDPMILQAKQQGSADLVITQPLIIGPAVPVYQMAIARQHAATSAETRARQVVRGAIAEVFYGLVAAREGVKVAHDAVSLAEHQLDLAQQSLHAGLADERAVLQSKIAVSRAQRDLLTASSMLVEAEEHFVRQTGMARDVSLETPPNLTAPTTLNDAITAALASRPDIAATEYAWEAARKERTARDLEWLPNINFQFIERYNQVTSFYKYNWQWMARFNLTWQIFNGGGRFARSRQYASAARVAALTVEDTKRAVIQEVRTAFERLDRSRSALASAEAEVELAAKNFKLAEEGLEAGIVTWLELEQARLGLDASNLSKLRETLNLRVAIMTLRVAMGDMPTVLGGDE